MAAHPLAMRPWDEIYERWIAEGEAEGIDPNDVGDREWGDPTWHVEQYFLPHVGPDSVVLELGPGTGRITRHVIGRCREMVLVDYSSFACRWLERYLDGRGRFRVHVIDGPAVPSVPDGSIDFAFAYGVFEHIGPEAMLGFLEEFHRVLVPGGRASFNFDNVMSDGGIDWLRHWRARPGDPRAFSFYHPDTVARLAEVAGFSVAALRTDESRHADVDLVRPHA